MITLFSNSNYNLSSICHISTISQNFIETSNMELDEAFIYTKYDLELLNLYRFVDKVNKESVYFMNLSGVPRLECVFRVLVLLKFTFVR